MISESDLLKAQKGRATTREITTAFLQLNPTTQVVLEVFEEFGDDLQLYSVCEPSATPLLSFFTTLAKNQQCFFSFSDEVNNDQNFIREKKCFRNFKYLPTTVCQILLCSCSFGILNRLHDQHSPIIMMVDWQTSTTTQHVEQAFNCLANVTPNHCLFGTFLVKPRFIRCFSGFFY